MKVKQNVFSLAQMTTVYIVLNLDLSYSTGYLVNALN